MVTAEACDGVVMLCAVLTREPLMVNIRAHNACGA